ncbi:hypothetical protein Tco_1333115 [Tanacetum coccineum]
MKKRFVRKKSLKKKLMQKESVSKQGRKPAKSEPTVHKDLAFDDLDDAMDYMEPEDAHDKGTVKDSKETRVSTEEKVSTDKPKVRTDKPNEGTAELKDGNSDKSAAPTIVFRDDETIAQFLVTISQNKTKQKGFEIKEIKDTDRPRTTTERSILTLKPLPKIDPKDKGKKVLEEKAESDAESEGVNEAERKFAQLANDEEIARKHVEEVAKELESSKVEGPKENIRKRSGRRLKMKAPKRSKRQKTDSDHEEENQLRIFLKIVPEEEENIDYEILGTRYPIINWESKFYDYGHFGRELIYYRVFRADGSSRWIKTFSEMIKLFDRMDLIEIHSLVMKRFETTPPEGIDLLLWGDLRTMFESKEDDELWKNQEEWKLQSWIFYENCGVHVLRLEDGTEINMLAERRYPLTKHTLERMMDLRLTAVSDDDTVFDLLSTNSISTVSYTLAVLTLVKIYSQHELWKNQEEWKLQSWIFYENCGVHVLRLEDVYNLSHINSLKIYSQHELWKNQGRLGASEQGKSMKTVEFSFEIKMDQTVPVQKQTAFGKDKSNPLIVDSLLKTIRLSIHLVVYNEELAIPEQTATGKGISNPLMAGSLPKTTKPT